MPDVIQRRVFGPGATDIHGAASLPARISVCGRDWTRDALDRRYSETQVVATYGREPTLVDPLPFAHCPSGPCTRTAQDRPCDTVVIVRVGTDVFVDHALEGGP